ncbi:RNA-directed DNA polymerase, eukaryota [Tanacetum coccineum]
MGSIDLSSVRSCWGNSNFDYVHSDSVGNSGGILCIWDPNSFWRSSFTRSDYFVIVRGVWLKSGIDLMIVVVYAPQEAKEKRMLWDYLAHVSNQWVGKLVMMGDFNEVRYKSDRYGSNFNAHDAEIFNSFIYNAGLDEVPLGGSAYTWCLKSASKMSKLDRFFVSENLLSMCPNITAITLERFISDHRPILLREVRYDYGPIPFRFYRYWLEVDGFDMLFGILGTWSLVEFARLHPIEAGERRGGEPRDSGFDIVEQDALFSVLDYLRVPCEDHYVWTLESDGVFSVASIRKEIDGNRFQDVSLPTRWVKSVPIKIQSKFKGVLEGVYYGFWWYMWNFRNKLLFDKKIPERRDI